MNITKKQLIIVCTLIISFITIGIVTFKTNVSAAGAPPYFSVKSSSEMTQITSSAVDAQYSRGYYLAPERSLEKIYRITVTQSGYLTFTANNPYKTIYNSTLKTTLGLVDSSGNCLWLHDYDYNYEDTALHSYRIGLESGVYYFYLKNNHHYLKNAQVSMLYNFNFTESNKFEIEPNNTPSMAKEYIYGNTIEGEYGCRTETVYPTGITDDYFKLNMVKGRSYDITFDMLHKGLYRSTFTLENASRKQLANAGDLVSKKYTYNCKKTGIYYLHIGNRGPSAVSIIQPYSFKIVENFTSPKTAITKIKRKGKKAVISWKKVSGVTGYQLQYGTNKKTLSKVKPITVTGDNNTKITISKLKKKKTYYIRIRTYTKSYNKTVKSSFSKSYKINKVKKKDNK